MSCQDWSYGYNGVKETRTVLITKMTGRSLGLKPGTVIRFGNPPVRTEADMTPEQIAALEAEYGCRVSGRFQWGLT
jgi:hypothetical protein